MQQSDNSTPPAATQAQRTVKVAAIQAPSVFGDVRGNTARFSRLCEEAAGNGAKFITMPEAAITGYTAQVCGMLNASLAVQSFWDNCPRSSECVLLCLLSCLLGRSVWAFSWSLASLF